MRTVSRYNRIFKVEDLPLSEGFDFWTDAYERGIWEEETHRILDQELSLDMDMIDVGAWVGPFCLYGSTLCSKIIALEPDPHAYDMLVKNLEYNEITNVQTLPDALWDGSPITLGVKASGDWGDSMTSVIYAEDERKITVQSWTFESLVEHFNLDPNNLFIKVDIEGAEAYALEENKDFIERYCPTIWLSLHGPLIEDKTTYFNSLRPVISLYGIDNIPTDFGSILLKKSD